MAKQMVLSFACIAFMMAIIFGKSNVSEGGGGIVILGSGLRNLLPNVCRDNVCIVDGIY